MPDLIEKYTRFCLERLEIPVIVKLQPEGVSPIELAKTCQKAGANAINFFDSSFLHALRIDIEEETVGWSPDYPCFTTFWGPWITPYICGKVVNFRKNGIRLDISASGGVSSGADVIRLIMAGANTVQAARSIMIEGWDIVREWLDFMHEWMERKGYDTLEEVRGSAVDKVITDYSKFPLYVPQIMNGPEPDRKMVVDAQKCIGCGWCEVCCSHLAVHISNEFPEFDRKKCEVCGLCEGVCPVGAISMAKIAKADLNE
jgi:ferredoxin